MNRTPFKLPAPTLEGIEPLWGDQTPMPFSHQSQNGWPGWIRTNIQRFKVSHAAVTPQAIKKLLDGILLIPFLNTKLRIHYYKLQQS